MTEALGTTSRKISSRFATSGFVSRLTPVELPPGWLRLATSPSLTGSPPVLKTIGIVVVAALAASADVLPPVETRTAIPRLTRSAASVGSRSYLTLCPAEFNRHVLALDKSGFL